MDQILLSVDQAAEALNIGRSKAYMLVKDGVIPSVRIGSQVRVPVAALKTWVASQVIADPASAREEAAHVGA